MTQALTHFLINYFLHGHIGFIFVVSAVQIILHRFIQLLMEQLFQVLNKLILLWGLLTVLLVLKISKVINSMIVQQTLFSFTIILQINIYHAGS